MENKKVARNVLSTGFALFSMFFGSGNLVFPLLIGKMTTYHHALGSLGLIVTGVLLPFLGAFVMWLYKGDAKTLFSEAGRGACFLFPLIALCLLGPFGVVARCITVAHGNFTQLLPVSLSTFSLISCGLIFLITQRKNRVIPLLGNFLTPLLLLSLAAIAYFGIQGGTSLEPSSITSTESFFSGFSEGYQTMDLLAAFFLSSFVIKTLQSSQKNESLPVFLPAAILGMGLLSLVYCLLVLLGALWAKELAVVPPEQMLGTIASLSLGNYAQIVVCIATATACFTTAIVLALLFADFLRKEICRDKINATLAMLITLTITFFVSTLEFSGIAKILSPLLSAIYPLLIIFTLYAIAKKTLKLSLIQLGPAG